ncbi:hypothetical protein ACFSO0_01840 [Brevibacillus sp. GCM10020057]|uniref:hypothetical protein n=1 Tax=Brevibacillus sp. GCM10020057 TaxID=3317327 RepID=UPI00362C6269
MRKRKFYFAATGIVLLFCATIGIFTRFSYQARMDIGNHFSQTAGYVLSLDDEEEYANQYFDNNIKSFEELENKSDLIVRVKPTSDRTLYNQAILSKVQVLQVYKKQNVRTEDFIYIFEPNYFHSRQYNALYGYNIMTPDGEYIFFLKKIKAPEGYRGSEREAITFLPVSTLYGKFPAGQEREAKVISSLALKSGQTTFRNVQDYEVLSTDQSRLDRYFAIRQEVMNHLQQGGH